MNITQVTQIVVTIQHLVVGFLVVWVAFQFYLIATNK